VRPQSREFLDALMEAPSPSGYEGPARKVFREYVEPYVDEVLADPHGNVIAALNPEGRPRLMLAGHIDEIGFLVQYVSDEGYIHFSMVGGVDTSLVASHQVTIWTAKGPIGGVVGKMPIHLMDRESRGKKVEMHKLWIDIGARNKADALKKVRIGDSITFSQGMMSLQHGLVAARGFDDKIGVFVVAETLRLLARKKIKAAVFGVATVQEELGLRGARTSAYGIAPDLGIAIDVDFATDFPGMEKAKIGEVSLGKGPVIVRGANINPILGERIIKTADKHRIPYQMSAEPRATGTDANAIQITRAGTAAALIGIPNRYMHTPVEVVALKDAENAAKLLAKFAAELPEDIDFSLD
jgi:putative aminopeptidase FrvX